MLAGTEKGHSQGNSWVEKAMETVGQMYLVVQGYLWLLGHLLTPIISATKLEDSG